MLLNKFQLSLVAFMLGVTVYGSVPKSIDYARTEALEQQVALALHQNSPKIVIKDNFEVSAGDMQRALDLRTGKGEGSPIAGHALSGFALREQDGFAAIFSKFSLLSPAYADVTAPQAPPELSDTLTDFRTKEQLTEQIYIEGKVDAQNSLQVPTAVSDLEAKVMRLSALYQAQYEIAVPRYGASVVRFYDLEGTPVEILDITLDKSGYIAEKTAATYELLLRQFQGAEETLLRVRFKRHRTPAILKLRPMVLVNQQQPVRTLITSLTLNFNAEQRKDKFKPHKFQQDLVMSNVQLQTMPVVAPDFSKVDSHNLEQALVQGAMVIFPLTVSEQMDSQEILDNLADPSQEAH